MKICTKTVLLYRNIDADEDICCACSHNPRICGEQIIQVNARDRVRDSDDVKQYAIRVDRWEADGTLKERMINLLWEEEQTRGAWNLVFSDPRNLALVQVE